MSARAQIPPRPENMNLTERPRLTQGAVLQALSKQIKPSWWERIGSALSPRWGVERMKDKAMLAMGGWASDGSFLGGGWAGGTGGSYPGGYTGARTNRRAMQQWKLRNNSADADIIFDLPVMRDRCRDLARNAPVATGAIGTVVQNVIGTGLQLQSQIEPEVLGITEDEATTWQTKTEREFRLFAESVECDITRQQTFYGLQALAFRSALESGDLISLLPMVKTPTDRMPYTLRVQLIEADRLSNPYMQRNTVTFAGGVEMDEAGAPIAYHIMKQHPGSIDRSQAQIWDRYEAFGTQLTKRRNVIHLFERTRPGQTRGVPYLAPVIETIKQLDRYTEAEIMATVVAAMFTVFIKTEESEDIAPVLPGMNGQSAGGKSGTDENVGLMPGAVVDLNPGEDITIANPNRPNSGYDLFVQSILRQIGIALGLPFEVLIKHFTASYSASRAALLDAWRFFRNRRAWMSDGFCQPIYEAWMDESVSIGRISAPGYFDKPAIRAAYLQAAWVGDSPMQIDPVKEADAAAKRLDIGVSTLTQETTALTGGVWSDNHRMQVKERKQRAADGLIASTTQVGAPVQRETITTAETAIPDSPGAGKQNPVPAGQPGGGGASPAAPNNAPQTPGKTPAAPAPPGKAAQAIAAAPGAGEEGAHSGSPESGSVEKVEAPKNAAGKPGKGAPHNAPPEPGPAEDEKVDDDLENEEDDENEGDKEDEAKK